MLVTTFPPACYRRDVVRTEFRGFHGMLCPVTVDSNTHDKHRVPVMAHYRDANVLVYSAASEHSHSVITGVTFS
jgi:hypothetical protein